MPLLLNPWSFNFFYYLLIGDLLFNFECLSESEMLWILVSVLDFSQTVLFYSLTSFVNTNVALFCKWWKLFWLGYLRGWGWLGWVLIISLHWDLLRSLSLMEWTLLLSLLDEIDKLIMVLFLSNRLHKIIPNLFPLRLINILHDKFLHRPVSLT